MVSEAATVMHEEAAGRFVIHLSVIPTCSYIADAYLKRHPEYLPLTRTNTPR